ncbi:MAG: hypothetical protein DRP63_04725, partial [Planctomycetota bacterium]
GQRGGAIWCESGSLTITNCAFNGNGATTEGGAICCLNSSGSTLTNCTFSVNNSKWCGGAICCWNSSPTLNNCILWGNSASSLGSEIFIYDSSCTCTLNYCCVDNTGYGFAAGGTIDDSNNCIFVDPQFVDAANGDYHLKSTSPCIDAGDNSLLPAGVTTDLDGNPRIANGTVDIGAYEYQSSVQPLHITTTSLPDATEGVPYSYRIQATGGNSSNYNWRISGQPSWLSINAATGELSGTPPAGSAGTYTFTVTVDDGQQTTSKQFDLTVNSAASLTITTTTLPEGEVGVAYPVTTLTATGGTPPYTWSDVNNTLQTYGLTLDSSTGEIRGTPTQATPAGGVTVTIRVTDANNSTAQQDFTLVIYPELEITTTSLPDGYDGQTGYSVTLVATGGNSANYAWSMSGTLPANLSWDAATATISGDIATGTAGDYPLQFEVTDGIQTVAVNLTLTVHAPLQITTTALPDGYDGQTGYSATLTATGGTGSYSWSVVSGNLPPNLALDSSTGLISGDIGANASTNSPYRITVEVTDGQQTVQASLSITVWQELQITTTSLPDGTEGVAYSFGMSATGGDGARYQWSASGLPRGLSIARDTGVISGVPDVGTGGATYSVTITLTDTIQTETSQCQLYIAAPVFIPPHADFTADPTEERLGAGGVRVTFTDQSSGSITHWYWDFDGDGRWDIDYTSPQPTVQHTYTTAGWYTVRLKVEGPAGKDVCEKFKYILIARDIYYVNGNGGSDSNSGADWNHAWKTIEHALWLAGDYDLVLVADATYNEHDLDFGGKLIYLKGVGYNNPHGRPTIDCGGSGRAFAFQSGETNDAVVEGFVIKDGAPSDDGGAIFCDAASPTILRCVFLKNWGDGNAGAIYCGGGSAAEIRECVFGGNIAEDEGGAILCHSSAPSITDCTFVGNDGGSSGGAICLYYSSAEITGCRFRANIVSAGGAIFCYSSALTVNRCSFIRNTASAGGAIIADASSSVELNNCVFAANTARTSDGGAIYAKSSDIVLTNCSLGANHSFGSGGAIYSHINSTVSIANTILWRDIAVAGGNEIYISTTNPGTVALDHCCLPDDSQDPNRFGGSTASVTEKDCLHADPEYVDGNAGVMRLKETSPCLDAGDDFSASGLESDIVGVARFVDGPDADTDPTVDIGAYEHQGIVYVDGLNGDDANDGRTWGSAKETIGAGIAAAGDGWFVFVADATYHEVDLDFGGKLIHLRGVDHNNPGQRPVIDCRQAGRAFSFRSGETGDAVLDNFVVQKGKKSGTAYANDRGGAVFCDNNSSPTILNCLFRNNCVTSSTYSYGGAIYFGLGTAPLVANCDFNSNEVGSRGGAIMCGGSSSLFLNCFFMKNTTDDDGGAVYLSAGAAVFVNCEFIGNSTYESGGAILLSDSSIRFDNCLFARNDANPNGYGGAILCHYHCRVTLNNCTLSGNNSSSYGGAIYA